MKTKKVRRARLDPKGTAKPLTEIVGKVRPGDLNIPSNVLSYEVRPVNPYK